MRKLLITALLLAFSTGAFAQEFFSTDGKSRRRIARPGRKAVARVVMYFDTAEVPKDAHRAGVIVCDERSREEAFQQAKDAAASFRCNAILMVQARQAEQRGKIVINNYSGPGAGQDAWVFYAYELPSTEAAN